MIHKLTPPQQPYERPHDKIQQIPVLLAVDDGSTELQIRKSSLRRRRGQFTFAVTAFVVGAIFILTNSSARNDFLAPGGLISPHAQILAEQNADRCAACHSEAALGWSEWATGIFSQDKNVRACQSQLCMNCHNKTLNDSWARQPHNLDPKQLDVLTQRACRRRDDHVESVFPSPLDENNNIECSACHREHHGAKDLARLTDQQCQTCHAQRYRRFESDHPEFEQWPQRRRQAIAFDHASHGFKHFPAKGTTFDCQACHVDDEFQSVKKLVPFEQACAQCHGETMVDHHAEGIAFVSLPMLDLDAIGENGFAVGQWPEGATGDFDGQVPAIMRLLLFEDERAQEVLTRRGKDFEFADLDPGDANDVSDAVDLVWAIKFLLHDLSVSGSDELYDRLQAVLQRPTSQEEMQRLMAGLNRDVILAATQTWLPQLKKEVAAKRIRDAKSGIAVKFSMSKPLAYVEPTFQDDVDEEDELIANPLENYAGADSQSRRPAQQDASENRGNIEQVLPDVDQVEPPKGESWLSSKKTMDDVEAKPEIPLPPELDATTLSLNALEPSAPLPQQKNDSALHEDLLVVNPLKGYANPAAEDSPQEAISDDRQIVGMEDSSGGNQALEEMPPAQEVRSQRRHDPQDWLADNPLNESAPRENEASLTMNSQQARELIQELSQAIRNSQSAAEPKQQSAEPQESSLAEHSIQAGQGTHQSSSLRAWRRDDHLFQISYQPSGHADTFLQQWMTVLAMTPDANERPSTAHFFEQITNGNSFGKCYQCHTIDRESDQSFVVNWKAQYRDPMLRSFTKFSHRPHLVQPQLADCLHCHTLDPERSNAHTFTNRDREQVFSNFLPIRKANCISCHHEGSTNNSCMQCHHYHIGSRIKKRN